jgi:hypothetical protein
MVLAVYGHPFPGDNTGEQDQFNVHEQREGRVQVQTPVRQATMQIDGGEKDRHLQDPYGDQNHPQQAHGDLQDGSNCLASIPLTPRAGLRAIVNSLSDNPGTQAGGL